MAKVSLTKLGLKVNQDIKQIEFNGQIIEVKQYLPVNEKLELISDVINLSADDNNFANPVKVSVFTALAIIEYYTNINFTEKQKEDPAKIYDSFISNGIMQTIVETIPEIEYNTILCGIKESTEAVYNYRNSVMGILDVVAADYSNLNLDALAIKENLADANNLKLVKDVLSRLG